MQSISFNPFEMARSSCRSIIILLTIVIIAITIFNASFWEADIAMIDSKATASSRISCRWTEGDPEVYYLKTKLGVNYEASHWFHMAENFMTQHSILRASGKDSNASSVYYIFDKAGFTENLNGVTRLMVYLGTVKSISHPAFLYFSYAIEKIFAGKKPGDILFLDEMKLSDTQVVKIDSSVPTENRFSTIEHVPSTITHQLRHQNPYKGFNLNNSTGFTGHFLRQGSCARYMGTIGGLWPTPQRGHWFENEGDISSFRQKIKNACPAQENIESESRKKVKYKLAIYQRDMSRKLADQENAIKLLQKYLPSSHMWDIQVILHSTSRSPCTLSHMLQDTDVLLTPHGFQSMLLLFLPRPALLFEIFPYKYLKRGYGPFSKEYGVIHSGVMSPPTTWHTATFLSFITTKVCMLTKYCRSYARNQDVKLTEYGAIKLRDFIILNSNNLWENGLSIGRNENQTEIIRSASNREFLYYQRRIK